MELEYFLNKYVIIETKEGKTIKGLLIDIKDYEDNDESVDYTTLSIRVDDNKYMSVYLVEIENIGEIV